MTHGQSGGIGVENVQAEFLQRLFKHHIHHCVLLTVLGIEIANLRNIKHIRHTYSLSVASTLILW